MSKKCYVNPVQREKSLSNRQMRAWARNILALSRELMTHLDEGDPEYILRDDAKALKRAAKRYDDAIMRHLKAYQNEIDELLDDEEDTQYGGGNLLLWRSVGVPVIALKKLDSNIPLYY